MKVQPPLSSLEVVIYFKLQLYICKAVYCSPIENRNLKSYNPVISIPFHTACTISLF